MCHTLSAASSAWGLTVSRRRHFKLFDPGQGFGRESAAESIAINAAVIVAFKSEG